MYNAGDVVMLPFPFSDLSSTKRRLVPLLTPPDEQSDFLACPITSQPGWTHARPLSPSDLAEGILPRPSWIRTDKVVTLHTDLIIKRFGYVIPSVRVEIAAAVCRFLDVMVT